MYKHCPLLLDVELQSEDACRGDIGGVIRVAPILTVSYLVS